MKKNISTYRRRCLIVSGLLFVAGVSLMWLAFEVWERQDEEALATQTVEWPLGTLGLAAMMAAIGLFAAAGFLIKNMPAASPNRRPLARRETSS